MAGAGWTCPSSANNCTRSDPLAGGSSYPPITALVNVSTTASNPQVNQASVTGGGSATASANDSTVIAGSGSATASFVAQDTTTSGNWQGVYGADGYCLANVSPQSPPGYATFAVLNPQSYTWTPVTTDPRALQISGSTQRIAAAWYSGTSVTLDVNLTDGRQHQVVVYALDWDSRGRAETLQVLDANSGVVLSSQTGFKLQ